MNEHAKQEQQRPVTSNFVESKFMNSSSDALCMLMLMTDGQFLQLLLDNLHIRGMWPPGAAIAGLKRGLQVQASTFQFLHDFSQAASAA